jgi:2,4-dienoyl-CoA reductase-like NADH-dependent reductase (Old Yellow Enzyme family)/NADPH-dependent 2,4-dienoyl-CoA reductase/sulfur reductase-like enzyme
VTSGSLDALFEPFSIRNLTLKNRLVQTSMYSWFATSEGEVSERHLAYMVERAKGGAGLIMVENTCIDWATGRGSGIPIRIDEDRFVPGLNDLANALHREGAKVGVQLYHAGRQSDARARLVKAGIATDEPPPLSASDVTSTAIGDQPRPMRASEIDAMVEKFAAAALRAVNAGIDVIEVHAVHGYLLTQFFSPQTNLRDDEYGGSLENRARFARRVVRRVREVVGEHYPLICRFSADERVPGGASIEDNLQLARWLAEDGIDVFNVSAGTYESRQWIYTPAGVEPGSLVPLATAVREATGKPVIGISRLGMDLDKAASFVSSGAIDLVGMGRSQLADPHTVRKAREGRRAEIRPCIACCECAREFIAKQKRMQCVVNPELGNEFRRTLRIAGQRRRIAVVGGGPAGMEAARSAAIRGHEVVLVEAEQELGGQLRHSTRPTFHRREMTALLDWWKAELNRLKVDVRVGAAVTPESVGGLAADEVLIATGAVWEIPKTPLDLFGPCPTSHEVLLDPSGVKESVVVVGGTEAGLNAAIALAESGRTTTLVERAAIGPEISDLMRGEMLRQAQAAGVHLLDYATVTAAGRQNEGWELSLTGEGGVTSMVTAQDVVVSAAPRSGVEAWDAVPAVRFLGTVSAPTGRLYQATQDGFWATAEI